MKKRLIPLLFLTLTACSYRPTDQAYYTREEYEEQKERASELLRDHTLDQNSGYEATLEIQEEFEEEWQRLPWETIDDWMERIHNQLVLNQELILDLRSELDEQVTSERQIAKQLQATIAQNEQMRELLSNLVPEDSAAAADIELQRSLPPPTFEVHLVRKGETLYSIARNYYSDPGMISEIMLWNQGWLRNPNQLLAGMALVLFNEEAEEKNEQVVEAYINRIPAYQ